MPLEKLSQAVKSSESRSKAADSLARPVKIYRWIEFANRGEQVTEFDESHFQLEGHFESNSSEGHKTYQDRLRAIHFRQEGKSKSEIAAILGRSEQFVAKWWNKDEREIPRPWGVHEYMAKELGSKTASNFAEHTESSEVSTAAWWRDVELKRKYHTDPQIYEELLNNTEWRSSAARTRDFSTGASHVKYDKEGKMKIQGNQGAKYTKGSSPAFDNLLQKFFAEYGIADRTSGIALNWYPDGDGVLGSHRHDCWTALFSFGHERILTIDKTPLLLQDSDLVIFGTQRHGVPKMPEVKGGRITVPIFFYPDHMQMKKQWQTLTDPEDPRRSRELSKLQLNQQLASDATAAALWSAERVASLQKLLQLGFDEQMARSALQTSRFDADEAAELLLLAGAGNPLELEQEHAVSASSSDGLGRAGRWASSARHVAMVSEDNTGAMDADVALALKIQMEDEIGLEHSNQATRCCEGGDADIDADAVLAAQLEEEDLARPDGDLIAQQFQEYEEQMKRDAAEEWHGKGDLMESNFRRDTLSLENMDKTTCFSIGHGHVTEKCFYELLQLNSIRVLYDFRPSDHRGDVHAPCRHFSIHALKASCRSRGITYKHIALGRESAYGILKHVKTDEARHALVELVWHAKRSRTCFLGFEEDWRLDSRQVVAQELSDLGHTIKHIDGTGAIEEHEQGRKLPDFLLQEEDRLRKLEKQRQAGELQRPEKSSVDRSSEAVASQLLRPSQEVDAMDALREASNQVELERVQRNLARMQRLGDKHGLLAHKVVKAAPQWIHDAAKEQEVWIAKKKAEKAEGGKSSTAENSAAPEEIIVQCFGCSSEMPWTSLAEGDGFCSSCSTGSGSSGSADSGELTVECARCSTLLPWDVLSTGDGLCPQCIVSEVGEAKCQEPQKSSESCESAPRKSNWRAARRLAQKASEADA